MPTFATFIQHCIEVLSMAIRQEIKKKKKEDIQISSQNENWHSAEMTQNDTQKTLVASPKINIGNKISWQNSCKLFCQNK